MFLAFLMVDNGQVVGIWQKCFSDNQVHLDIVAVKRYS